MKIANALQRRLLPALVALVAALPLAVRAQASDIDPEAIRLLSRTTEFLAAQKQFRVDTDATIEVVLASGQKLQFGNRAAITVQRPDRLRVERVGDLVNQTFQYDGKALSVNLPDQKYYATIAAPSTMEATLDFARDELDVIAPGADLIYGNAHARLTEGLTSAFVVGKAIVGGVQCDHVAFRNAQVDWQIWIEQGDKPVPRKYIVTSKRMPGSPQFMVVLTKWDGAPRITAETFAFVAPEGAQKIPFLRSGTAAPAQK